MLFIICPVLELFCLNRICSANIAQRHKEKEIHIKKRKSFIKKKKNKPRGCVRGLFLSLTCTYLCIRLGQSSTPCSAAGIDIPAGRMGQWVLRAGKRNGYSGESAE